MKTDFFKSKQFRLFAILIMTLIVVIIFCVSAFSYYYSYYTELFSYRSYLYSLWQNNQSSEEKTPAKTFLDPQLGNANAKVTLFLISDFRLPASIAANGVIDEIYKFYGQNNILIVWKDYATNDIPENKDAALAAHCASMQNKFWEYKDALLLIKDPYTEDIYLSAARSLGLDTAAFASCYEQKVFNDLIMANYTEMANLGLNMTPVIYINKQKVTDNINFNNLRNLIDSELKQ